MNSNQIFEQALGFEKAWFVKDLEMTRPAEGIQGQIDIFLDFDKGFKCPGGKTHDTVEKNGKLLNFFQHKCHLSFDLS